MCRGVVGKELSVSESVVKKRVKCKLQAGNHKRVLVSCSDQATGHVWVLTREAPWLWLLLLLVLWPVLLAVAVSVTGDLQIRVQGNTECSYGTTLALKIRGVQPQIVNLTVFQLNW